MKKLIYIIIFILMSIDYSFTIIFLNNYEYNKNMNKILYNNDINKVFTFIPGIFSFINLLISITILFCFFIYKIDKGEINNILILIGLIIMIISEILLLLLYYYTFIYNKKNYDNYIILDINTTFFKVIQLCNYIGKYICC